MQFISQKEATQLIKVIWLLIYIIQLMISFPLFSLKVMLLSRWTTALLTNSIHIGSFHSESLSSTLFKFGMNDFKLSAWTFLLSLALISSLYFSIIQYVLLGGTYVSHFFVEEHTFRAIRPCLLTNRVKTYQIV